MKQELHLTRLVYTSRARTTFSYEGLQKLAENAIERNRDSEITGYLCFRRRRFLQYIEGSPEAMEDLLERLEDDARHTIEQKTPLDSSSTRSFPDWSMRYLADDAIRRIQAEDLLDTLLLQMQRTTISSSTIQKSAERLIGRLAERERREVSSLFEQPRIPPR